jgi:hypothetical protein
MTATSHPKRVFMRLAAMETLGFFDSPARVWTSTPVPHPSEPASPNADDEPSGLITLPIGKHSRHAHPTGELVRDIWDSTELNAPSLVDWTPQGVSDKHLERRRFRWPMLALLIVIGAAVAGAALWLYRQPDNAAATALGQVRAEAEALSDAIAEVLPLLDGLASDRLPEENRNSAVFFEMGERARTMFAVSAELPAADSADRGAAAGAAGLAIDASRQLMDATAYRTALEPALTLPVLEVDPDLTDLATATETFTEWRGSFDSIRAGLPVGVATQASAALDEISTGLETTQTDYLDALRTGNRTAAVEVLGRLRAELLSGRQAMLSDMAALTASVSQLIEDARAEVDRLLG